MNRNHIIFILFIAAAIIFMTAVLLPKSGQHASTNQSTVAKPIATECEVDTDCQRVGCGGQFCLSPAAAATAATSCEQQEQYRCFELDNCICYNHTCGWMKNKNFMDCEAGLQQ